jgi:16S rRNA (guanine527-N7)-methyltransferase
MTEKYHNIWRNEIVTYLEHNNIDFNENSINTLLIFLSLLASWNKKHNLTSVEPHNYISRHVIDSLCLLPYANNKRFLDVGTGAGFPGIPLAIFATNCETVLLDVSTKKCCFLRQAVHEAKLTNVTIEHTNIVDYNPNISFDIVVARAFTSMSNIINMTKHVCNRDNGVILAMKAKLENTEIDILKVKHEIINISSSEQDITRCIVKVAPFELKNN